MLIVPLDFPPCSGHSRSPAAARTSPWQPADPIVTGLNAGHARPGATAAAPGRGAELADRSAKNVKAAAGRGSDADADDWRR